MPDFVVIGAAKAGTTSLYAALDAHPGVHVAPGEPGYWARSAAAVSLDGAPVPPAAIAPRRWHTEVPVHAPIASRDAYDALFADAPASVLTGEVCPLYLESVFASTALAQEFPDCRIVVSLRDPVERAWSSYWMHVRDGLEDRPPQDAFGAGEHRVQVGRYHRNLIPWSLEFARIKPLWFETWTREGLGPLADFLGLSELPAVPSQNVGGRPRSKLLGGLVASARLRKLAARLPTELRDALKAGALAPIPPMPDDVRVHLQTIYEDEAAGLADLFGEAPPWPAYSAP